jgi:hypothetical protein
MLLPPPLPLLLPLLLHLALPPLPLLLPLLLPLALLPLPLLLPLFPPLALPLLPLLLPLLLHLALPPLPLLLTLLLPLALPPSLPLLLLLSVGSGGRSHGRWLLRDEMPSAGNVSRVDHSVCRAGSVARDVHRLKLTPLGGTMLAHIRR